MKNLILCTNLYPGPNQEPFLAAEVLYLQKQFINVHIHRLESVLTPSLDSSLDLLYLKSNHLSVKELIKKNFGLLFKAFCIELIKSKKTLFYLRNTKRYFNIWIGWLQESAAWGEALKEFDPKETIIYTYWYENQAMPLTILRAQGKLPFKWISRAHGWDVDKRQRKEGIIPFRHWMLEYKPDRLMSISNFGKEVFKTDYNAEVEVSKLGTNDLGLAIRNENNDVLNIVSISSLIPLKRVHLIIESLKQTQAKINWVHYGDGPLKSQLEWKSLPANISMKHKGFIAHTELLKELKEGTFDMMIHLSKLEGIPVSIMECMSMGITAMACDTGGVSEIVDNENGWLLPIDIDPKELAKKIDSVAQNKDILDAKRKKARKKWENEYQADVNFPYFIDTVLLKN